MQPVILVKQKHLYACSNYIFTAIIQVTATLQYRKKWHMFKKYDFK